MFPEGRKKKLSKDKFKFIAQPKNQIPYAAYLHCYTRVKQTASIIFKLPISTAESGHVRLHMENVHIELRTVSVA